MGLFGKIFRKDILYKIYTKINLLRFGKTYFKDNFIDSIKFYDLNKKINFNEFKIRKKINFELQNKLISKIDDEEGFKIINIKQINKEIDITNNLYNLRKNFDNTDWTKIEKEATKKYLLIKRLDIDKDLSKLIEFLLPIVSSYIGSLPSLLDASYWYSPNKNDSLIGSQKWHMDHEDFRQLKVFIPIDHNINDKTGSLTLINKKLTHDVFYLLSKNKKNLRRGAKFDDEDFIKVVSDKNKIISTNYSVDDIMFVDTCNCYHYGSRGSTMSRKVLQLHFTSSFSYVIPIIFRKTLDKKNLINNVISYYNNNISYNLY